ncbi:1432_t:CDS:10 [Funneliformis caledonium]|uniref:1432_t:CDS:1 n=1 Tax=Funneliformis caledonium TaxID=1117310 RepID=A0A9N9F1X6_9GLOM|nr:1432_t:CDS:10 [Funneliformis caledonium]
MSFLFKSKQKTPHELVKILKDAINKLDGLDKKKASEDISKNLTTMKTILYGDGDSDPVQETVAQLAQEVYNNDILQLLVLNIWRFEFEAKKDVSQIFNNLLRRQIGSLTPTVDYLTNREEILFTLLKGYENPDIALNCGMILRECLRHESLTKIILYSPHFYDFFTYVEMSTFDIASDAFATFKEILTRHKTLVAEFLDVNYEQFFESYTKLLNSNNYVTKRQSLKLLGEILLDRCNFNVMTRYIASSENLKLMMNLLRDRSRNIQFEAFHVFKIFVANPNKTKPISDILSKNREKLIQFLGNFHNDRHDDEQFNDEKAFLLKQIQELPELEVLSR